MSNQFQKTETDYAADRKELLDSLGVEYSAVFVPQSKSRNAGKDPCLNWRVSLKRGNQMLETDYMEGIGHLKGFNLSMYSRRTIDEDQALRRSVENGVVFSPRHISLQKQPTPSRDNVLYCLVLDADAIDYPTFEDWADNFGYDSDSREAEKIYRQCLEIGLKLRAMFGDENLNKLREYFSDY